MWAAMGAMLRAGLEIDRRYVLEARIGEGAFGEVWKARAPRRGIDVALKFMRPELAANTAVRERFEKEAVVLQRVQHPNVVQVLDSSEWEGTPFLATEFVSGGTLQDWLLTHPPRSLRIETARDLLAQVCAGLGAAHAQGIVHRDLKPANVLLVLDGQRKIQIAKVADFGLAREEGNDRSLSSRTGTMAYASPEQGTGKSHTATASSDVFALAVLSTELLTGSCFADSEENPWWTAALSRQTERRMEGMRALRADVPAGVWSFLVGALQWEPARRPDQFNEYIAGG